MGVTITSPLDVASSGKEGSISPIAQCWMVGLASKRWASSAADVLNGSLRAADERMETDVLNGSLRAADERMGTDVLNGSLRAADERMGTDVLNGSLRATDERMRADMLN